MLALLLTGWSGARAVLWENPFPALAPSLDLAPFDLPLALPALPEAAERLVMMEPSAPASLLLPAAGGKVQAMPLFLAAPLWDGGAQSKAGRDPRLAAAHHLLGVAALRDPLVAGAGLGALARENGQAVTPSFLPAPERSASAAPAARGERWSVDAWAFWRQGSDSAPISLGRVPIYGASQAGAVLQYRLAPGSRRDPRAYARAYRALVRRGENELAVGASARPLGQVPLRAAAEVRYTDGAFSDTWRPAAFAVTELPPMHLPFGAQLEVYGQAGWVGGQDPTGFADGQASVTGEVRQVASLSNNAVRLSFGAAAWGGAQEDAQRIDVGPTLRLDLRVGAVPARLSVDWRERVGGDARPVSGLAATLSTRF